MEIEAKKGKKAAKIKYSKLYGNDLCTTRNGYQWTCFPCDDELLELINSVISDHFKLQLGKNVQPPPQNQSNPAKGQGA